MMDTVFQAAAGIGAESWRVLAESAPFMLLGFFFAGLIKGFVPDGFVARALGKRSVGSVLRASLFGVPLPLCSCSVLPTAQGLRKQGAGKGAVTAFLISTPETGADSIAVTYALLGPFMAVVRPVAAFLTATLAGLWTDRLDDEPERIESPVPGYHPEEHGHCHGSCCGGGCDGELSEEGGSPLPSRDRFMAGMRYAFGEMIADIGMWFLIGVAVAGVIGYFVPAGALADVPGGEWGGLLAMLLAGLPLYVCASSSTPVAASLMLKGLSPGAALVFLLAGPATNGATLTVVLRILGRKAAAVYVASIAGASLALGWLVNRLDAWFGGVGLPVRIFEGGGGPGMVEITSAVALLVLFVASRRRTG